jgi:hypothetical protein
LIILILIGGFTIQGLLIKMMENNKSSNEMMKTDMDNLIEFYHDLQNIGLFIDGCSIKERRS